MANPENLWKIELYVDDNGRSPFEEWFDSQEDKTKARILTRIDRIERGNFGDHKSIGQGVYEFRFSFGGGYRVYYGKIGKRVILLLCGGDKDTQAKDIKRALEYWRKYRESKS